MSKVFEGILWLESTDDGGMARIIRMDSSDDKDEIFVRVQSWDQTMRHEQIREYEGKRVRITIELIE